MMKAWQIRENFELIDRIAISRRAFEELFTHTKERIEFTFKHGTPLAYLDGRKFSVSPEFTLNA